MKIEIKHRTTNQIIISGDYESTKDCLEKNRDADLGGADLRRADLGGAYLGGADLRRADLRGADLGDAILRRADLRDAYLGDAKNYRDSHEMFMEIVRRQKVSTFTELEWSAIAQITIHRLCWSSIKKRFSKVMPHIFQVLADDGFNEWLDYWKTC